jgi:uncharacterized protein
MLLAVIADPHLPRGSRELPPACVELLAGADAIIHAGDLSALSFLDRLRAIGPPVHAVHGNVDEPELVALLPRELELELTGRALAIVHDAGPAGGRLQRLRARFHRAEAVIFGHSHVPLLEAEAGFQIFNPGSPTDRRRQPERTMGLVRVSRDQLAFEHVPLGV